MGEEAVEVGLGEGAGLLALLGQQELTAGGGDGGGLETLEEHLLQFVETTGVGGTELAVGGITAVGLRLDGVVVV